MPGDHLSFATMFGWSDDWFFAPGPAGISLFAAGQPVFGDVTDDVLLYNDGAELSEAPEVGLHQGAPAGASPDPVGTVRPVPAEVYATPVSEQLRVTLAP